jgi:hypothetical protein
MCGATGLWAPAFAFGVWLRRAAMLHLAARALGAFLGLHHNPLVLIPVTFFGATLLGAIAGWLGQSLSDGLVMTATNVFLCEPAICSD